MARLNTLNVILLAGAALALSPLAMASLSVT